MPLLTIRLFGNIQIALDDQPLVFPTEKVKALLVLLASDLEMQHQRDYVASMLYPDYTLQNARTNLRQLLSRLRDVLQDRVADIPLLLISRQTLQLNPENLNIVIDVAQLQQIIAHSKVLAEPERMVQYEQAVALYQGEFLAHFSLADSDLFDNWAALKRAKFQAYIMDMLEDVCQHYETLQDWQNLKRVADEMCRIVPFSERGHRYFILSNAALDRRSEALTHFEKCEALFRQELGVSLSPQLHDLLNIIRDGKFSDTLTARDNTHSQVLPPPTKQVGFIGRMSELQTVQGLLSRGGRLITITGLGGMGKTMLASEVLATVYDQYLHGVATTSLAALSDEYEILSRILRVLALPVPHDSLYSVLRQYLQNKQFLLLLDNVETDDETQRQFIASLLQDVPTLQILATARMPMNIPQEQVFRLAGFAVEHWQTLYDVQQSDAGKLFIQAAEQVNHRFELQSHHIESLREICAFVDGLPLAIQLAATWVSTLTLAQIAAAMHDILDVNSSAKNTYSQQERLRVILDYSWQRLTRDQQIVLHQLTIFAGTFSLKMATEIATITLEQLRQLVTTSLVKRVEDENYTLHPLVKLYLHEKSISLTEHTIKRYTAYYLEWLATFQDVQTKQLEILDQLEQQLANIQQAWRYAIENQQYDLIQRATDGLYLFSMMRSYYVGGEMLLQATIDAMNTTKIERDELRDYLRLKRYWLLRWRSGVFSDEAVYAAEHILSEAKYQQADALRALALSVVGNAQPSSYPNALHAALEIYQQQADQYNVAWMYHLLAQQELYQVGIGQALQTQYRSLRLRQQLGDRIGMIYSMYNLSTYHFLNCDLVESRYYATTMLEFSHQLHEKSGQILANTQLGFLAFFSGDMAAVAQYADISLLLAADLNHPLGTTHARLVHALHALGEGNLIIAGEYAVAPEMAIQPYTRFLLDWINAAVAIALGQVQSAKTNVRAAYQYIEQIQSDNMLRLCLPLALLISHKQGDQAAVDVFRAGLDTTLPMLGWAIQWPPLAMIDFIQPAASQPTSEEYYKLLEMILKK